MKREIRAEIISKSLTQTVSASECLHLAFLFIFGKHFTFSFHAAYSPSYLCFIFLLLSSPCGNASEKSCLLPWTYINTFKIHPQLVGRSVCWLSGPKQIYGPSNCGSVATPPQKVDKTCKLCKNANCCWQLVIFLGVK